MAAVARPRCSASAERPCSIRHATWVTPARSTAVSSAAGEVSTDSARQAARSGRPASSSTNDANDVSVAPPPASATSRRARSVSRSANRAMAIDASIARCRSSGVVADDSTSASAARASASLPASTSWSSRSATVLVEAFQRWLASANRRGRGGSVSRRRQLAARSRSWGAGMPASTWSAARCTTSPGSRGGSRARK